MEIVYEFCKKHNSYCLLTFKCTYALVDTISRCWRDFENPEEAKINIYAELVGWYYKKGGDLTKRQEFHWDSYASFYREYYTSQSEIAIRPLTNHRNTQDTTITLPKPFVRPLIRTLSERYIRMFIADFHIDNVEPGSLADNCMRRLSWEHIIYGLVGGLPQVVYTTDNFSPASEIRLYKDFFVDGALRGSSYNYLRPVIPGALSFLERALDCDDRVGTLLFKYSPKRYLDFMKVGTSGGIIESVSCSKVSDDGVKYVIKNSGSKIFQIEAGARDFHRVMIKICKGEDADFAPINIVKLKQEFKLLYEKAYKDLSRAALKKRTFFICNSKQIALSSFLFLDRMYFERGEVITIGIKWWHGGAWEFAKTLNYDNPDIFWADGDIESLDKHIKDWQLYLYIAAGSRYYNWQAMNREQKKVLKVLINKLMYHISNKIVLHVGTFWRFMRGVMYSGGKETSHGDSWVMAFVFYLYINDICRKLPHISFFIKENVRLGYIKIAVYGDDHIWCAPKVLRNVINVQGFAHFLQTYLDMNLRDYKEYDTFLSLPDTTGGLLVKGPKFLKVYFIPSQDSELPPVLPYRPMFEPMTKMFLDVEGQPENYVLKSIGFAYGTYGTNPAHYAMVKWFYDTLMTGEVRSPYDMYQEAVKNPNNTLSLNKLIKRCNMTAEQAFDHFPSADNLRRRHIYDPHYVKYGNKGDWLWCLQQDLGLIGVQSNVPYTY